MRTAILIMMIFVGTLSSPEAQDAMPEPYQIRSIYFGGGNWHVDPEQKQALYDWIDGVPNLHEFEIVIHSHTDNIGSVEYNKWLSQMRSESVYQLLLDHAVPADWLFIRDYGELNPHFDNSSLSGRLKNRRVDVLLIPPSS